MRFATCSLCLALLLLWPGPSFCEGVSAAEIAEALNLILTELETASTEQDVISTKLDATATRQEGISGTLATVVEERLPAIVAQVTSLETSFNESMAKEARDDALMLGALVVTFIIAVIGLIF